MIIVFLFIGLNSCNLKENNHRMMKSENKKCRDISSVPISNDNKSSIEFSFKINNYKPWKILAAVFLGLINQGNASDKGLIGYFDGDCPDGWEKYDSLIGRVAVGAGNYIGAAEDGRTEAIIYSAGNIGGEVLHTITESETKSHFHYEFASSDSSDGTLGSWNGGSSYNLAPRDEARSEVYNSIYAYILVASTREANKGGSSSYGGDQPHNNMPPYLVLNPCINIQENIYASQENLSLVQANFRSLKSEINQSKNIFQSNITSINSALNNKENEIQSLKSEIEELKQMLNNTNSVLLQSTSFGDDGNDEVIFALIGTLAGVSFIVSLSSCIWLYLKYKNKYINKNHDNEVEVYSIEPKNSSSDNKTKTNTKYSPIQTSPNNPTDDDM